MNHKTLTLQDDLRLVNRVIYLKAIKTYKLQQPFENKKQTTYSNKQVQTWPWYG